MRNRGVLAKLLLLVVIPVVAICGMGIYGTWNTWATYESVEQVHGTAKEFRESAQEIGDPLNELRQLSLTMVMAPTHEQREELKIEQDVLTQRIDATFENWSDLADDETSTAFQKLKQNWENYKRLKTATVEKVLSGYREEAFINAIAAEADQFELVRQDLAKWMTAKIDRADSVYDSARRRYATAFWVSTALIAGVVLTMGGFGLATMRSVIQPIQTMRDAATRIAENTSSSTLANALDERIRVKSDDELGELAKAFNQMVENLGKATQKLSVEEQRIQAILNSTADGIITVDRDGVIRSFNASAERLLGYRAGEAQGMPVTRMLPKLAHQRGENLRESIITANASSTTENERQTEATTKDGTTIATAVRVTEMNYCGEQLAIVTLQDIRERKQAEAERERLFSAIRDAVKRLSAASRHILESTSAQARGAQEQASTVTETVATAEEISNTTEQAVSRANEMSATARRTGEIGDAGRSAIKESVHAMEQVRSQVESIAENILSLAERAQAIGEITATVNDIAEQTNVLALNAAVEASRAGEHGKGFAVVAAEVKSLAEQSKKATSQVRHILSEIQQATNKSVLSTEQGTKSVSEAGKIIAQAGETIDTLASALSESARSAAQIAASANQQAAGVEQLNEGVLNIDSITRQNGEAIKHIEVSAKNLSELSRELDALTAAGATQAGVAEGI